MFGSLGLAAVQMVDSGKGSVRNCGKGGVTKYGKRRDVS